MKVVILYHPESDHARSVEEYAHDYIHRQAAGQVELRSLDTREGAETATLYDVVQYPAVLATDDKGVLLKLWEGTLPLMNEVAGYNSGT